MNIGFIGLGNMGSGMAMNILKAGHALTVYDIKKELIKPLKDAGASQANSPKKIAQASDIVFTSLPGPDEVEAVALGEHGQLKALGRGWYILI